jgi:hypothetical protein
MLRQPITKILSDPLAYPFEVPKASFCIRDGGVKSTKLIFDRTTSLKFKDVLGKFINRHASESDIQNPVGFLTCGSNASPTRLAEKLEQMPVKEAYALRMRMPGWIPVYAATVSYYGSVPATFEFIHDRTAEPFLVIMDSANLPAIVESEQRSGNYYTYLAPRSALKVDADFEIYAFVSKYGALKQDGQPVPVREFLSPDLASDVPNQARLVEVLLEDVAIQLPATGAYQDWVKDQRFVEEFRRVVNERFASGPNVPGWLRQNL